jgi:predicted membrane channel-forming protein YqfA (hemolysin III family)
LSLLLGLLALVAQLLWHSQSPRLRFLLFILFGSLAVPCMLGLAWTRKSFGMLANYILLTTIDSVGLIRMLM